MSFASILSAQWVKKANALKPRSELGSLVYDGKFYTFFGFRDYGLELQPSSEVYTPSSNSWKLLASLPQDKEVSHAGIALIDDNVWVVGGRLENSNGPLTNAVWIYNITKNTWSAGPQIKDPATGKPLLWGAGGAAFIGRTLHVFGGFTVNSCNDQDTYHLTLNVDDWLSDQSQSMPWKNELAPMPVKRNHFGTVVLGGKIYAIGGQFGHDCGGGQDKQYSHVYNPATDVWTQLPMLPTPRSHIEGGTFAIDGKIYIVAGQSTSGKDTKQVTIFDPAGNNGAGSWKDDNNLTLSTAYEGICAKVINNTFIISHGGAGGSRYPQNTTYSRTLSRTPVYKLVFPTECLQLNDFSADSLKGGTWLSTIDGTKAYSTSSNAGWLTVTKNASGNAISNGVDIEVTANTTGLAPGSYSAIITASGTAGGTTYAKATLCVNLTVHQSNGISTHKLQTASNGSGTVVKTPDQPNYSDGASVTLKAIPDAGQQFTGWSGSTSGTANPLTAVMNDDKTITANFQAIPSSSLVTNLTTTSTKSYVLAQLKTNIPCYTDRDYKITSVPAFMNLAPFIKTPNSDKSNNSSLLIKFNLTQSATVYVAYDPRSTVLPAWLKGWQKSTSRLGIADDVLTYLDLYSKVYPAGYVTLGGNKAAPAAGSLNNYLVIAVAQAEQLSLSRNGNGSAIKNTGQLFNEENTLTATLQENQHDITVSGLKIYPNPFDGDRLKLEIFRLPQQQKVKIVVSDVFGKVYKTLKETTDKTGALNKIINFDKVLSRGIYILNINSALFTRVIKVVVK